MKLSYTKFPAVILAANDQAILLDVNENYDKEKVLKRYDNLVKALLEMTNFDDLGYAIESELVKLKSIFASIITLPTDIKVTEPIEVKKMIA